MTPYDKAIVLRLQEIMRHTKGATKEELQDLIETIEEGIWK